jgi:hypothetical protein
VPYSVNVKDAQGNINQMNQTYCESLQTSDKEKVLTVCDGMDGMARIFNANGGVFAMSTSPMGWNFNYQILSGVTFDTSAAVRGSVASWKVGDFNYNIADQYATQLQSGNVDTATATAIGSIDISESTAEIFNIPVCRVFDLASFPPANGASSLCCACAYTAAVR